MNTPHPVHPPVWAWWALSLGLAAFAPLAAALAQEASPANVGPAVPDGAAPPAPEAGVLNTGPPNAPDWAALAAPVPISLNVQQASVREILLVFAELTGLNFVLTEGAAPEPLTLRLQQVPWPQALEVVLRARGLMAQVQERVVWVVSEEQWLQRERKRLQVQATQHDQQAVQWLALPLRYARAAEVAQRLLGQAGSSAAGGGRWLTARGTVLAEPRTNQLFLSDVPASLQRLRQMIERLDVPVRQVLIEARIVEADEQFGQSLGVRLGLGQSDAATGLQRLGGASAATGAGTQASPQVVLPAGTAGQAVVNPASVAVSIFNASARGYLNLELSALEADGRGKIVSRPRVVTADQTKALIEQGTELPYQSTTSTGGATYSTVSFRKANLKLEVTPQITPEGAVMLEVDVNRDSVGQLTANGYTINTRHVKTLVRVADGGTAVLGGVFEDTDKNDEARVPALADLPLLGWLFRNRQQLRRRSELLVFLTPQVLDEPGSPQSPPTLP